MRLPLAPAHVHLGPPHLLNQTPMEGAAGAAGEPATLPPRS